MLSARQPVVIILGLCLCCTVSAEIIISAEDIGNGRLRIGYSATDPTTLPAGVNLDIALSNDALILSGEDVVAKDPNFPLFMDYIYDYPTGYTVGRGNPLARNDLPGEPSLPASEFTLGMGAVDTRNIPQSVEELVVLQLWGYGEGTETTVSITPNTTRGGIVSCSWAGEDCIMGSETFETVAVNVDLTGSQVEPDEIVVEKCLVKADANREPGHDFRDTLVILGSGMDGLDEAKLAGADTLNVTISNSQNKTILGDAIALQDNSDLRLIKGRMIYKPRSGTFSLIQLDTTRDLFMLVAKAVNLTGLDSPFTLNMQVEEYSAAAIVADASDGSNDVLNGRGTIPMALQMGYADALAVTKAVYKGNPRTGLDTLVVAGELTVADVSTVDLTADDITVSWGTYSVDIPAADVMQLHSFDKYVFKPARGSENPVAKAYFDFERGFYQIVIKNAPIGEQGSPVSFGLAFGAFDQSVGVTP